MKSLLSRVNSNQPSIEQFEETLSNLRAERVNAGLSDKGRPLMTRQLAEEVGLSNEFQEINRICSKLVHPTAFSILDLRHGGEHAQLKHILFMEGAMYGIQTYMAIAQRAKMSG